MERIIVGDITGLISPNSRVCIYDRKSEKGTVFDGYLIKLLGKWNSREVVWLRPCKGGFILEIE